MAASAMCNNPANVETLVKGSTAFALDLYKEVGERQV